MENKEHDDPLLERAKTVLSDGNYKYTMFLYREILKKYPENLEIRKQLHKLRKSVYLPQRSFFSFIKKCLAYVKILYAKKHRVPTWQLIDTIETWIDYDPTNFSGYRLIAQTANAAHMYNLTEFSINEISEEERTHNDYIILAEALLGQKKFDKSLKIANTLLEKNPDDNEAKDIVWKSSVDKQMDKKLDLVMANGISHIAPPKVDTSQIIVSNHKNEGDEDKDNGHSKQKQAKHNKAFE